MKKNIILLFLALTITPKIVSIQYEYKIYRRTHERIYGFTRLCQYAAMGSFSVPMAIAFENTRDFGCIIETRRIAKWTLAGGLTHVFFNHLSNGLHAWNNLKHKPILIFDEEGFTYEAFMGRNKRRQDKRYLWKNVISHWVEIVRDQHGSILRKEWKYHIAGESRLLSINVFELDIPRRDIAKVESLRQGRIRALWDS